MCPLEKVFATGMKEELALALVVGLDELVAVAVVVVEEGRKPLRCHVPFSTSTLPRYSSRKCNGRRSV
jgi:hypothetical protein